MDLAHEIQVLTAAHVAVTTETTVKKNTRKQQKNQHSVRCLEKQRGRDLNEMSIQLLGVMA